MDAKNWENIKKGDSKALKVVYQSCYQDLYSFGFRVTADKEKVKDAIHEMFCEIWQKRNQLSEVSNIPSYLKTYLKRKLLKELVHQHDFFDNENMEHRLKDKQHSYEYLLIESQNNAEQKQKIYFALNHLTSTQREIIELKFYEGFSYEQIASLMNLKIRTVYNHVYEAMIYLRKNLK